MFLCSLYILGVNASQLIGNSNSSRGSVHFATLFRQTKGDCSKAQPVYFIL